MVMRMATAGLLVIEDRKLLLAYSVNKNCFYLPGGKVEGNETAAIALCREIAEEMNVTIDAHELKYYTHITAPAYGEQNGTIMEQDCFFLQRDIAPQASAEIGQLKYFSLEDYHLETNRAPGVVMILAKLKDGDFIA